MQGAGNTKPGKDTVVLALRITIYGVHRDNNGKGGVQLRGPKKPRAHGGKPRGKQPGRTIRAGGVGREQPPKHEGRGGVLNSPKVSLDGYKARKTVWHSNETLDASLPLHHRQGDPQGLVTSGMRTGRSGEGNRLLERDRVQMGLNKDGETRSDQKSHSLWLNIF